MNLIRHEDGSGSIKLTPEEYRHFLAGKKCTQTLGDKWGLARVDVSFSRPRSRFFVIETDDGYFEIWSTKDLKGDLDHIAGDENSCTRIGCFDNISAMLSFCLEYGITSLESL